MVSFRNIRHLLYQTTNARFLLSIIVASVSFLPLQLLKLDDENLHQMYHDLLVPLFLLTEGLLQAIGLFPAPPPSAQFSSGNAD